MLPYVEMDESKDNFLLWLLEQEAKPGERASVYLPRGGRNPEKKISDWRLAEQVTWDLLHHFLLKDEIRIYERDRITSRDQAETRKDIRRIASIGFPEIRHTDESIDEICARLEAPRRRKKKSRRWVSLTEDGLIAARNMVALEERLRRSTDPVRRNRVRAAALCWLYSDPSGSAYSSVDYMIGTSVRPRIDGALVTLDECERAEESLLRLGLVEHGDFFIHSTRVALTSAGIRCVERFQGDWGAMRDDKRKPAAMHIGVIGPVVGQNVSVQSVEPKMNAKMEVGVGSSTGEDLTSMARQICELAHTHADELEEPKQVQRDALELAEELERPDDEQDRARTQDVLHRIIRRGGNVASIVEIGRRIMDALFPLA